MAKTRHFQVINRKIQFRCFECGTRRHIPIPANRRRKSIRCHKCNEITNCLLNRRNNQRQTQSGKASMITRDGSEMDIHLRDFSSTGIGFDILQGNKNMRKVAPGQIVSFKCPWNPSLFSHGKYVIKHIQDQKVGVERLR